MKNGVFWDVTPCGNIPEDAILHYTYYFMLFKTERSGDWILSPSQSGSNLNEHKS
jgi:hypothetical protein